MIFLLFSPLRRRYYNLNLLRLPIVIDGFICFMRQMKNIFIQNVCLRPQICMSTLYHPKMYIKLRVEYNLSYVCFSIWQVAPREFVNNPLMGECNSNISWFYVVRLNTLAVHGAMGRLDQNYPAILKELMLNRMMKNSNFIKLYDRN